MMRSGLLSVFGMVLLSIILVAPLGSFAADLDTWMVRASNTTRTLMAVTSSSTTIVTVGDYGTIRTSQDGAAWSSPSSGTTALLFDVCYGNGLFVAVGLAGTIRTSPSGTTWTARTSGTTNNLFGIAYGNGLFVATGSRGTILTSSNGSTWTARTSNTVDDLNKIVYGNGLFVAVGNTGRIMTSPDGVNWTPRTSGTSLTFEGITFGGGLFVAVAGTGVVATSPDAITWTIRASGSTGGLAGVAYGADMFLVSGGAGALMSSSDGITFAPQSSGTTSSLQSIIFAKDTFIIVGSGGIVLQSNPVSSPQPPTANAGPDQTIALGTQVALDGSSSTGTLPLSYSWSITLKPSGSAAVLTNPDTVIPSFTPDLAGDYVIRLVVTDATGLTSRPDEATIKALRTPAKYYVDFASGVDNSACSKDQPCKHVPGAPSYSGPAVVEPGDTVYFKRGVTYGEYVGLASIPTVANVTYTVDPSFTTDATQDKLQAVINGQGNENIFWITGNGVKISGLDDRRLLKLTGAVSRQAIAYVGKGTEALSSGTIEYLEITVSNTDTGSNGMGIRVGDGPDTQAITGGEIHHNLIHDCGGYGIKCSAGPFGVSGVNIHDNEVYRCGGAAALDANVNISSDTGTISVNFHHNRVHDPYPPANANLRVNAAGVMVHDNELYGSTDSNLVLNPAFGPGTGIGRIYNNFLHAATQRGMHIGGTNTGQGYLIYNNLFMGNGQMGIYFEQEVDAAYSLLNNTVYCAAGEVAMKIWGSDNNITVRNNIFYTQNAVCVLCPETPGNNSVDYNIHYRADGGDPGWYANTSNSLVANPLFETSTPSATSGIPTDFRITSSSPAKEKGETRSEFATDYFGTARPFGTKWDIGFHESTVLSPGILAVAPSEGFSSSGPQGGPFSPSSKTYTLTNSGNTAINWTASKSQPWDSISSTGGTLAPGATITITVSLAANNLAVGSYSDTITFTNTTNGTGSTTRAVSLTVNAARPDLIVSALTVPSKATPGSTITITDSTKNAGSGTAPPTTTRFYLSRDSVWQSTDAFLGSRSVPALAAAATSTGSTSVTIPIYVRGTWYIIAKADAGSAAAETNENNNTASRSLVIAR